MPLWILLFVLSAVTFGAPAFIWWQVAAARRRRRMVDSIVAGLDSSPARAQSKVLIEAPAAPGALSRLFRSKEAGSNAAHVKFLLLSFGMMLAGAVAGLSFEALLGPAAPVIGGGLAGAAPWLYRARKRNKRLAAIEEQFPEALDFLGRSLRAGNAFSIGLELLAVEVTEPLKSEIQRVTREMALGASLEDALNGLMERVELVEVRLFVSAVLLQKETGGNLNEILAKLSVAVRERLRLQGQVKAMSGQGRLTAAVLSALPVVLMLVLKVISPRYLDGLTGDPVGRNMLAGAVVSQLLGFAVMRKIIRFEV
jgi:tight adherence protein B